jgi:hypothetical protein
VLCFPLLVNSVRHPFFLNGTAPQRNDGNKSAIHSYPQAGRLSTGTDHHRRN